MQVTFVNVGYGDAILLQMPDGYTALLDGGSALNREFDGDPHRIRCIDYLRAVGIRHLDAVWISHIHEDHVCGLEPILQQVSVGRLYVPYPIEPFVQGRALRAGEDVPRSVPLYVEALNAYQRIICRAREANIPIQVVQAGDELKLSKGLIVRVLAPREAVVRAYIKLIHMCYSGEDDAPTTLLTQLDSISNRTSLLLRIEAEGMTFLAAADSCPSEWEDISKNLLKNVNVLKLPHHGQKDSISEHFMRNIPLRYVITTAASDRRYHSANPWVYEQLSSWYPPDKCPRFLFTDERSYPPYFSQPDGFQAITLVINSGEIFPEFVKFNYEGELQ